MFSPKRIPLRSCYSLIHGDSHCSPTLIESCPQPNTPHLSHMVKPIEAAIFATIPVRCSRSRSPTLLHPPVVVSVRNSLMHVPGSRSWGVANRDIPYSSHLAQNLLFLSTPPTASRFATSTYRGRTSRPHQQTEWCVKLIFVSIFSSLCSSFPINCTSPPFHSCPLFCYVYYCV